MKVKNSQRLTLTTATFPVRPIISFELLENRADKCITFYLRNCLIGTKDN